MTLKVLPLTFFTLIAALFSIFSNEFALTLISILFTSIGLISILVVVANFKKIELQSNILTIKQSFDRTRSFKLDEVASWSELSYSIRGQLKRSLILFLSNDEKITISIYDDINEFDKLSHYLKTRLPERKN